jgi:hypothetical protein
VEAGKSQLPSNIAKSFGTTAIIITAITHITTNNINIGYIIADFIFQEIHSTFSIWFAKSVSTLFN